MKQLSLLDYKPDPYAFMDRVDNETLYGHLLRHQQSAEFRQELDAQLSQEITPKLREARRQHSANYRLRNPTLVQRRIALEKGRDALKELLRNKQGNKCLYCNCDLSDKAQLDHRKPMIRGGSDHIRNLALVCAWCNRHKGTMSEKQWRARVGTPLNTSAT